MFEHFVKRVSCFVLASLVALPGCFRTAATEPSLEAEHHEASFERDVRAIAGAPYGIHMHVTKHPRDPGFAPIDSLVGMRANGEIVYEHRFVTNFPRIEAVASDAQGRAYIVHIAQQTMPMDFGLGPQTPEGVAPWYGTLVAYSAEGVARFAVPIPVEGASAATFDDLDASDEGVIVVCGGERVVSGFVSVWVFEPDGTLRAKTRLPAPPLAARARCVIDEEGRVLVFGPEADLDHPSASVANPGLVVLDASLEVLAEYVLSAGVSEMDVDPRGQFVLVSRAHEGTAYVGRHAIMAPVEGSTIFAAITDAEISPYALPGADLAAERPTAGLVHDAIGAVALYGFTDPIHGVTRRPIRSDDNAGVALLTWNGGDLETPIVAPYASAAALPSFAAMMGDALVLVDQRDGMLYLDTYRTLRVPRR